MILRLLLHVLFNILILSILKYQFMMLHYIVIMDLVRYYLILPIPDNIEILFNPLVEYYTNLVYNNPKLADNYNICITLLNDYDDTYYGNNYYKYYYKYIFKLFNIILYMFLPLEDPALAFVNSSLVTFEMYLFYICHMLFYIMQYLYKEFFTNDNK